MRPPVQQAPLEVASTEQEIPGEVHRGTPVPDPEFISTGTCLQMEEADHAIDLPDSFLPAVPPAPLVIDDGRVRHSRHSGSTRRDAEIRCPRRPPRERGNVPPLLDKLRHQTSRVQPSAQQQRCQSRLRSLRHGS